MATMDDVVRIAQSLPEVTMRPAWGNDMWRVRDKGFVWARPLNRTDRAHLGVPAETDTGSTIGVRTESQEAKEALLGTDPDVYFTIPHFDGSPVLLVQVDAIDAEDLHEVITGAWIARAPKRLAAAFLQSRSDGA
ncbi:MmcQ/YjbR family DNA-binding protein [Brevibacterium litoralis]|uniref:MmcQ/YjbR family DNA-binding protein n=1 Tax=Brevibacterium litoralis TaxID=3138935 RepID=UPI0032EBD9A9